MKTANWPESERLRYEMEIDEEDVQQQRLEDMKAEGLAEGEARGEAKSIAKSFRLKESDQDMIEEHTTLTPEKLSKIKGLTQPPKSEDIFKILVDGPNIQDLSVELSGASDMHHTHNRNNATTTTGQQQHDRRTTQQPHHNNRPTNPTTNQQQHNNQQRNGMTTTTTPQPKQRNNHDRTTTTRPQDNTTTTPQ